MTDWGKVYEILKYVDPILGAIGFALSIIGFGIAIVQLAKTRKDAVPAQIAAKSADQKLRGALASANLSETCSRSRDLLHLLRAGNLAAAANAAFELREAVARLMAQEVCASLQSIEDWGKTSASIASIHERLESAALIKKITSDEKLLILHEVSSEHEKLSSMAARVTLPRQDYADS
jgi:hypothetical protein